MVSQLLAQQLKEVVAEDFGREISLAEAAQILDDLTGYFDLLARLHHQITQEGSGSASGEDIPDPSNSHGQY